MTNSPLNLEGFICPLPLRDYPQIVMGHGSGGRMSNDLVKHLFLPHFDNAALNRLDDQAVLDIQLAGGRLAFTTDSFVVQPLFFPGGDIGQLAVHGTVNDLAVSGAAPLYLSAGFILEEGLKMDTLGQVVVNMARAAQEAGVQVVTGDTKVVDRGHGDGIYINTSGVGIVPPGVDIAAQHARPGDRIIISGMLGDHGVAVMSVREGLDFEVEVESDSAPLNGLVQAMLEAAPGAVHAMRDCTRGGLAASLNELAGASGVGVELEETALPVRPPVRAACEMLGLDPLYVANEGKLVAFVQAAHAGAVLEAMQAHPLGRDAAIIGAATEAHPGLVAAKTGIGGSRVVDMPLGVILPRIC